MNLNHIKDSHCNYCGTRFTEQKLWPRKCFHCYNDSYKNPIPVIVSIIPVAKSLRDLERRENISILIEQRGIEPEKGGWALPGGYIDFGETWSQAAARETQEEIGLITNSEDYSLFDIINSLHGNMLIFAEHKGILQNELSFVPNEEVEDIELLQLLADKKLCFPSHQDVFNRYSKLLLANKQCLI